MIYLASPYSGLPHEREYRHYAAFMATGWLWKTCNRATFSPIVHSHNLAKAFQLPTDADFWKEWNTRMLRTADELFVLTIFGWHTSYGVQDEIFTASQHNRPIKYLIPKNAAFSLFEIRDTP